MKALDEYFLMVVFTLLLDRVHTCAYNFMFNEQRYMGVKGLIEGIYLLTYMVRCTVPLILRIPDTLRRRFPGQG